MESIKWWQSDTIRSQILGLAAAIVAAAVAIGAIFGVTIDPVFQGKLIAALMALFAVGAAVANVWGLFARLNTTTVISGSKGEKSVLNAGTTVIPRVATPPSPPPSQ